MNTRKSSVELLRILGCFFVIMAHIPLTVGETAGQISSRLVFSSIMADNVPLFLLAAGFFMFRGVSDNELWPKYTGKIKKTLINVYIPAVIIVFLTCLFMPWLGGSASFVQCFKGINLSRFGDLKAFLLTFNAKGESGHLWYVLTYVSVVFFFPLFAFVCQEKPERIKFRRIFEAAALLCALLDDLAYFLGVKHFDVSIFSIGGYFLYILLGYELSVLLQKYKGKKYILISAGVYLAALAAKYLLQRNIYLSRGTQIDARFVWLQSFFCCATACALFAFVYLVMGDRQSKVINFIGKRTFFIYLVHRMVICKTHDLKLSLIDFNGGARTLGSELLYYIEYGLIVFALSFILGYVFELCYNFAVKKLKQINAGKAH